VPAFLRSPVRVRRSGAAPDDARNCVTVADVVVPVLAGVLGLLAGALVNRLAGAFPWGTGRPLRPARRLPWPEAVTAALFVLVSLRFAGSWALPAFLVFSAVGVLLALIDLAHRLLPDRVVLPALGAGAGLLLLAAALDGDWAGLARAYVAAALLFVVFLVLALLAPAGLAMGDVKLAAVLGLYLGWVSWRAVVLGGAAGFVVQAVAALALLAARRVGRKGELPFGPSLLVGALFALFWA
jgi:leader peptidase (prepilin peptidase)/N-methyltransferase